MMLSTIFVINITNPSETRLSLTKIQIEADGNAFSYERDFTKSNAYWVNPHSSKLIAVSQTVGLFWPLYGAIFFRFPSIPRYFTCFFYPHGR